MLTQQSSTQDIIINIVTNCYLKLTNSILCKVIQTDHQRPTNGLGVSPIEWPLRFLFVKTIVYAVTNSNLKKRISDAGNGISLHMLVKVHEEWIKKTTALECDGQHIKNIL